METGRNATHALTGHTGGVSQQRKPSDGSRIVTEAGTRRPDARDRQGDPWYADRPHLGVASAVSLRTAAAFRTGSDDVKTARVWDVQTGGEPMC